MSPIISKRRDATKQMPRCAVITPYYRESEHQLRRCIASVRAQTVPATHFLVADGHPQAWIDDESVRHVRLDREHGDYGNTPRGVGALLAVAEEFDAIALLDADNWLDDDHVELCFDASSASGDALACDYVVAQRRFRRPDETVLPVDDEPGHVDTNCFFLLRGSFHAVAHWATMPREVSPTCDRVFRGVLERMDLRYARVRRASVNYECLWAALYRSAGETPPPNAKPNVDPSPIVSWLRSLDAREIAIANRLAGTDIRAALFGRSRPAPPKQDESRGAVTANVSSEKEGDDGNVTIVEFGEASTARCVDAGAFKIVHVSRPDEVRPEWIGEFVAWQLSRESVARSSLRECVAALRAAPNASFVRGGFVQVDESGEAMVCPAVASDDFLLDMLVGSPHPPPLSCALFRAEAWSRLQKDCPWPTDVDARWTAREMLTTAALMGLEGVVTDVISARVGASLSIPPRERQAERNAVFARLRQRAKKYTLGEPHRRVLQDDGSLWRLSGRAVNAGARTLATGAVGTIVGHALAAIRDADSIEGLCNRVRQRSPRLELNPMRVRDAVVALASDGLIARVKD